MNVNDGVVAIATARCVDEQIHRRARVLPHPSFLLTVFFPFFVLFFTPISFLTGFFCEL